MKKKDLGGICCNVRLVGRGVEMSGFATIAEVKEGREGGTLQSGLAVGTIRVSGWIVGVIVQNWEV